MLVDWSGVLLVLQALKTSGVAPAGLYDRQVGPCVCLDGVGPSLRVVVHINSGVVECGLCVVNSCADPQRIPHSVFEPLML